MKKAIVLLLTCIGLFLLPGVAGRRPQIYDPNSECGWTPSTQPRGRMLEYRIIVASDPNTLAEKVTDKLKDKRDRWIPIGGISVANDKCHQAMAKVTQ